MQLYLSKRIGPLFVAATVLLGLAQAAFGAEQLDVLAAQYRADAQFPQFEALWHKSMTAAKTNAPLPSTGGSLHIYLHNGGAQAVTVEDVLLEGVSLTQAVAETDARKFKKHLRANSIYFSKLPAADRQRLIDLGEPIWWRVDPATVMPGGVAEVLVRLRKDPSSPTLKCGLKLAGGAVQEISVPTANVTDRCADVCFSPGLDSVWLYFEGQGGRVPKKILLDGQNITLACKVGADSHLNLTPVFYRPDKPVALASLHCFQAVYGDGTMAIATARVFPADFVYGLWGAKRAQGPDPALARAFVQEMVAHNVNLQMPGVGSPAVATFYKSEEGRALLAKLGVRRIVDSVGKAGDRLTYAYYLADEPDAADSRVPGVPSGHQVGCLAQGLVGWSKQLRKEDPLTPNMVNIDSTFCALNWRIYGQLPDIFAADPYYQPRLREAYGRSPERVPLFSKATYVYAESAICKASSQPRPVHIMLYGNRYEKGEDKFRGPTPPEKRIEAYYAVAGGAKGLSYWWYLPGKPAVGLGAAEPGARALWREVGLVGAELRTAGPLISRSSPLSLPVSAPAKLWVKALAVGLDSLILVVVNDDYTNDPQGTKIQPVPDCVVRLTPPAWLGSKDVFEVQAAGIKPVTHRMSGGQLELDLGTVDVTRLVVLTSDATLRQAVQRDHAAQFELNVRKLLNQ